MGRFYDEYEIELANKIKALTARKEAISAVITGNSPADVFRELHTIDYKLLIAESHLNRTFGKNPFPEECYTRLTT